MADPLDALSPLDGRHAEETAPLTQYGSEAASMRARTHIEVEYLIALADLEATDLSIGPAERSELRALYEEFDQGDAALIKKIETKGHAGYDATNHDVKAVEYFLRYRLRKSLEFVSPWIHFGLTSEDINNLARRILVRDAIEEVLIPDLEEIRSGLAHMGTEHAEVAMLGRTHGQPATPTTFGKEMAVFEDRLVQAIDRIRDQVNSLAGKLSGATGTYGAQHEAYPEVDWIAFAEAFVTKFRFEFVSTTTQINPCDDLAALLDGLRGANEVLLDLCVDSWLYVGDEYLSQGSKEGEVGSSTMPHKVNPIDFEIAEGNLAKANSDLDHLASEITNSRLQRDLSDAPSKRHLTSAMGYSLVGYSHLAAALESIVPNEPAMNDALEGHPEVIGEAIQTILRREGHDDAYERVKKLTRDRRVTKEDLHDLFYDLDVNEATWGQLKALTPASYTGLAERLAEDDV